MSGMDVPLDIFTAIEREISSEASPVGIDAKKTHIIILHKLQEIDERLRRIEDRPVNTLRRVAVGSVVTTSTRFIVNSKVPGLNNPPKKSVNAARMPSIPPQRGVRQDQRRKKSLFLSIGSNAMSRDIIPPTVSSSSSGSNRESIGASPSQYRI